MTRLFGICEICHFVSQQLVPSRRLAQNKSICKMIFLVCENASYQLWLWLCLSINEMLLLYSPLSFYSVFTPTSQGICCCLPLWTSRCIFSSMVCTKSRGKVLLTVLLGNIFFSPSPFSLIWNGAQHVIRDSAIICASHLAILTRQSKLILLARRIFDYLHCGEACRRHLSLFRS